MAVRYENQCVGCPSDIGCLGDRCPNANVAIFTCDVCGYEFEPDDLYDVDGDMVCRECLTDKMFPKVKAEDYTE